MAQVIRIDKVTKIVNRKTYNYILEDLLPFTTYTVNVTAVPSTTEYRPPAKITVTTQMAGELFNSSWNIKCRLCLEICSLLIIILKFLYFEFDLFWNLKGLSFNLSGTGFGLSDIFPLLIYFSWRNIYMPEQPPSSDKGEVAHISQVSWWKYFNYWSY